MPVCDMASKAEIFLRALRTGVREISLEDVTTGLAVRAIADRTEFTATSKQWTA